MTASQSLRDKLKQLQHLLRHRVPSGEMAVITELAFDLLIEKTLKQRFAQVSKPRSSAMKPTVGASANVAVPRAELSTAHAPHRSTRSRHIPSAVLREVFDRDGGQCTFESLTGHRCNERGMLEVHHVHAFALGGESTTEKLKLVCKAHNSYFADQDFGAKFMQKRRASLKPQNNQAELFGR